MNRLKLELLGRFKLSDHSGQVFAVSSKKARLLLAYLACRPGFSAGRNELAQILWEHHEESQALTNLRQCISVIHRELEGCFPKWLLRDSGRLSLNVEIFEFEFVALLRAPGKQPDLEQLVATCQGEFLEGLTIPGEKIDDWLNQQRNRFEFALIDILKRLVDQQVAVGEFEPAAIHAEKLVSLDPLNEAGHRALMSIYASLGQQHRILRQYQLCCQALESSQVLEPSEDTKSLFQQLYHETSVKPLFEITAPADTHETVSKPPPEVIPAIAVLPFKAFLSQPDSNLLITALTEEIVSELRRYHGFRVISALSSLSFGAEACDFSTAANALGARYLVSGSIRQYQQKILIAVELVDAANGELIWADRYSRQFEDLLILQTEMSRSIAGAIEPEALGHDYLMSSRKSPQSLSAWDLVLRGDHHLFKQLGTRWNSDEAQRLYRRAMNISPDYAPAYAGFAYSQCLELKEGIASNPETVARSMKDMAEHAVRLDENNPWCLVVLGRVLQQLREFDAAVLTYQKAVKICPSSAKAHFGLGFGLSATGEYDDAISAMNKAIELSPRDPMSWSFHTVKALTYLYSEQFEQAAQSSQLSSSHATANHWAPVVFAPSLIHLGQFDKAQQVLENARRSRPDITIKAVETAFPTTQESDQLSIREGLIDAGLPRQ